MPVTRSTSGRAGSSAPPPEQQIEKAPATTAETEPAAEASSGKTGTDATRTATTSAATETATTTETTDTTANTNQESSKQTARAKSTKSKKSAKNLRLARAREDMLKLQVKLAAARIATMEAEEEEESDNDTIVSDHETARRVDNWLNESQPHVLAITDTPHVNPDTTPRHEPEVRASSPPPHQVAATPAQHQSYPAAVPVLPLHTEENKGVVATRSSQHIDLSELASAIALAARSGTRSKFTTELPIFGGAHQDWLTFKAAYEETASLFTETENMARLRRNLKGRAKEAVENLLMFSANSEEVMKTLENRFGRPDCIALAELERLRALPRLTDSAKDVCIFASRVTNIVATLRALKRTHYLYNPETTKLTIEKLTPTLRYRWFDFAADNRQEEADLLKLSRFLSREAERCGPYAPPETITSEHHISASKRPPMKTYATTTEKKPMTCPVCEKENHDVYKCNTFNNATTDKRWDIAKEKKLCFSCLRYRTRTHHCRRKKCEIDGCKYAHNRLLHHTYRREEKSQDEVVASTWVTKRFTSYLKIVPVRVSGPAGAVNTYALLDDGSTVTLIDADIARQTGAQGPQEPLRIEAISDCQVSSSKSRRVHVSLRGPSANDFDIQARTIENMCLSAQAVDQRDIDECDHLRDIRHHFEYEQAAPRILVGQDNWHLLLPTEVRVGRRNQPVASHTALGWVMHGASARTLSQRTQQVNFIQNEDIEMNEQLRQYIALDSLHIEPRAPQSDPEQRALVQLDNNVRLENGRYEAPLLWKREDMKMPDNYEATLKRLHSIEKKLDRDPVLKEKYNEQMNALIAKGYAEPAPAQKHEHRTWYLPHFVVLNPMKPDKIRIVHDAAAKTRGVSLNDHLYKGPDLLQSLPGVLMRFRQRKVAVSADIKEMFKQVKIKKEDRDALRYLWRGDRRNDCPPTEYRMTSLIFGATCSPAIAIYVKDRNARNYEKTHPDAVQAIIRNHYVDDFLQSFDTVQQAIDTSRDVDMIHRCASYELRQWTSNSGEVLDALEPGATPHTVDLDKEKQTERILGLEWRPHSDDLGFNLNLARLPPGILDKPRPTKRETLKILMSLFDPLGFASPVTIKAKQILQDIWRRGTEWDAEIDEDLAQQWAEWTQHLRALHGIKIPRCYLHYSEATSLQLHVFVDASESAYAAAAYWRVVTSDGNTHVSLVAAKTKVAPLKLTSIPRLELQAAVLGSRLAAAIRDSHDLQPSTTTYWTDSKTVITWLKTGARSYRAFVAHRIAAIEENSTLTDWRWIPTKMNVADDATRNVPRDLSSEHRWYTGPPFLRDDPDTWPTERPILTETTGEEKTHTVIERQQVSLRSAVPDYTRFSKWERLLRSTARVLQFVDMCKSVKEKTNYKRTAKNRQSDPAWSHVNKQNNSDKSKKVTIVNKCLPLDVRYVTEAELLLVRVVQNDAYGDAPRVDDLRKGPLKALSVVLSDGLIRIKSRISATSDITEEQRRPLVLDGTHHITKLYIEYVHRKLHHSGVEATMNECRARYWITRVRTTTRMLIHRCRSCQRRRNMPPEPPTGDLPACRLAHHQRAFTHTGIDYFGPLTITVGRGTQKRYGALFTCLTTRAVHIEIAASLTTDSAVMALRRFIARRGCPTEIWSDNGTNLRGADKELRQALDTATEAEANTRHISWRFIPPGAPFMGGAWERLVRSVKTALYTVMTERQPNEEVLATLLAEVEFTVNNRPLTHISVNPDEPEALKNENEKCLYCAKKYNSS